jgi:hypothetical protein
MFSCSCLFACAEDIDSETGSSTKNVTAKYSEGVVSSVYSVDIEWGSMEFEYTGAKKEWDPEEHKYITTEEATWTSANEADRQVTVINHSDNPINVAISYASAEGYEGITGSFDITSQTLDAAEENSDPENAPTLISTLTLSGELSSDITTFTTIGSAKVQLSIPEDSLDDNGIDESTPAGTVTLYSRSSEDTYNYETNLYRQSSNVYVAQICADSITTNPYASLDTKIKIGETDYYIYEPDDSETFKFKVDNTVNINTSYYPDGGSSAKRKETVIEANVKYILTITLDEGGATGKAKLEVASA